ncbi:50S ribosomal protein L9 [Patescibacteria group bacterium]|nr:50S ribosomal protein L9 [Patescibacteria group bacterium]
MRVILLKDIQDLGKKYDIKEVEDGFARNSLLPKGVVKMADEQAMKWLEIQKEIMEKEAIENLAGIQKTASEIDGMEVIFTVKVGEEGQLFEHITAQKISDKLKEMGFKINKDQINLEKPIDQIEDLPVKVKFEHNLESEIQVIITEEK